MIGELAVAIILCSVKSTHSVVCACFLYNATRDEWDSRVGFCWVQMSLVCLKYIHCSQIDALTRPAKPCSFQRKPICSNKH